jgi:hypothetical protein
MGHVHHEWLRKVTGEVAQEYERLHRAAKDDPQRAGHGGEGTWARLLEDWLPPQYEVATRRYIIPEEGGDSFETDLIVFSPGYPRRMRGREEVLAGGVAAAFSVKLTLNAAGIRDAAERAVGLRRSTKARFGTPRSELLGAFPVALLAHSHAWKRAASNPVENVYDALIDLDAELVQHPREMLDFVCVADLGAWTASRFPYLPPHALTHNPAATEDQRQTGCTMTAVMMAHPEESPPPVAVFVSHLLQRLAHGDPSLRQVADGMVLTETQGRSSGDMRLWDLNVVFDERVVEQLPTRGLSNADQDWLTAY